MSTSAKAGIAIGIIAVVGLFAVFLLWLLGKKRKEREAQAGKDNEKTAYPAGTAATEMVDRSPTMSSATAPRLSLRPISRMLPEFMGSSTKGRLSSGNLLTTVGEAGPATIRKTPSPQPRGPSPVRGSQDQNPNNPFADPQNPFADPEKVIQAPAPAAITPAAARSAQVFPAVAAGAVAAAVVAPARKPMSKSIHDQVSIPAPKPAPDAGPAPVPVSAPAPERLGQQAPSPAPSTPVTPAPIVAVGPGPEPPQGNVYRILMDFKPSMEDELELQSGQLVRLLHEYDDGWVSEADIRVCKNSTDLFPGSVYPT